MYYFSGHTCIILAYHVILDSLCYIHSSTLLHSSTCSMEFPNISYYAWVCAFLNFSKYLPTFTATKKRGETTSRGIPSFSFPKVCEKKEAAAAACTLYCTFCSSWQDLHLKKVPPNNNSLYCRFPFLSLLFSDHCCSILGFDPDLEDDEKESEQEYFPILLYAYINMQS